MRLKKRKNPFEWKGSFVFLLPFDKSFFRKRDDTIHQRGQERQNQHGQKYSAHLEYLGI